MLIAWLYHAMSHHDWFQLKLAGLYVPEGTTVELKLPDVPVSEQVRGMFVGVGKLLDVLVKVRGLVPVAVGSLDV